MFRSRFSTKIEDEFIELYDACDSVRFSFIVQNSISYLNLDLGEYSKVRNLSISVLDVANDFVSTEEKCRKIFTPTRSLLYTLHLDIPAGREHSLKNDLHFPFRSYPISQHLARILMFDFFHHNIIAKMIECAFQATDQTLKILAFLLKSPFLKKYIYYVDINVINTLIDYFYPKICNSLLLKDFIEVLNLERWINRYEKPEVLEFLLYHARYYGRDIEKEWYPMCLLVDNLIYGREFSIIRPILKYADTFSGFCSRAYGLYVALIEDFRPSLTREVFTKAETLLAKERIYLIFPILWAYIDCNQHGCIAAASEAFRLIWNSSSDPFICLEEVKMAFSEALSEEDIRGSYDFYCNSIGEIPLCVEPRTLQQLCRTTIRRTIKKKNLWIPEGIEQTGLPTPLQSYLNLGEVVPILNYKKKFL